MRLRLAAILGLALGLLIPTLGAAQEVLDPNPDIEATIQSQFNAFLDQDVDEAFQYASPNIQGLFQTPERFGRMVEEGYPMVWAPSEVQFVDLQTLGGIIIQRVQVVDLVGNLHVLAYQMVETDTGWRINGVQLLRTPEVGA